MSAVIQPEMKKRIVLVNSEKLNREGNVNDPSQERHFEILLIEDNSGDVRLMQEAFKQSNFRTPIHFVGDGVEAMAFLRQEGSYAHAPRPDLIVLDLNLPRKDGRELLAEIKRDDQLKRIPVIVLTTSRADQDVLMSYNLHANCYLTKPTGFQQLVEVVRAVKEFWLGRVKLPPK